MRTPYPCPFFPCLFAFHFERRGFSGPDQSFHRRTADQHRIWPWESTPGLDIQRISYRLCGVSAPGGMACHAFWAAPGAHPGSFWWGVTTALTALMPAGISHAVMLLIAIRFALGAGEAVIYPAANQFVARWVPLEERGLINGLIFAGVGAGSGLTPPLLTWLITDHGWRAAFWFSAAHWHRCRYRMVV
jgi:hypothetical protein